MRFHVTHHLHQAVGSLSAYDLEEQALALAEGAFTGDVAGRVALMRTDRGILVSARLRFTLCQRCSRCLAAVESPMTVEFQEEYLPMVDVTTGERLPIPEECDNFLIDAHQTLDLTEAIRQYGLLAEPMQPLCQPDCAGLCPHCGADLNLSPCGCPSAEGDTRWAVLRSLAAQLREDERS
ncbi:MAG: DUF177 domain-containing protein [Dehalococcoidia bacterium]